MTRPESQSVTVPTDAGEMPAHLWLPPSGSGPGLLLLQEIFGVSRYIRSRGADLAEAGYVVVAPELYWRLDAAPIDEGGEDAVQEAMGRAQQLDWPTTVQDAVSALTALRGRPELRGGTGVLGFCLGGGLAFNVAAVDDPDVLVSYYGSSLPELLDLAPEVTAPSLHHFGESDSYIDGDSVERVRAAVTSGRPAVEFETYPGADHAFDNPDFMYHHPEASALAWDRTLAFLHRELPVG
jgi:carboxymethylenebutenolidase